MILISLSIENVYSPAGSVPPSSYLISCTPIKYNLYLDRSFETVIREPVLSTFQISRYLVTCILYILTHQTVKSTHLRQAHKWDFNIW
jgi:hypothetical protein